jgi:hypothetical protein
MSELRWESWAALLAFAISLVYIWAPGPYPMGAFTFIAQPLFLVAFLSYLLKVLRELRQRKVL